MKRHTRNIITLLSAALAVVSTAFAGSKGDSWSAGEQSRRADYIYMEALRRNALEQPDAYFELIDRAYQLAPGESATGQDLGYYYMVLSENDTTMFMRGYEMMKDYFDSNPGDYFSGVFYGTINDRLGMRDESVRVWTVLDSIFPSKIDVTMKLAEALGASGDTVNTRKALDVLNRVEVAEGKNLAVTSQKIRAMFALNDTADIYRELHSLLDATPRSAENRVYAGDLFMALNKPDSAIVYYDNACEVDSTSGLAYYKRAEYYKATGDSTAYDREVFHALTMNNLELDTKLEILTGYIRELYTDESQQPRIKSLFGTLLENHPHEASIHDLYCAYLVAIDDFPGAAEQQSYVVDSDPSREVRWTALQSLYMQASDYDRGASTGERALHYFPESSTTYLVTATCYAQLGEFERAQDYLRKAMEFAPDDDKYRSQVICTIGDTFYQAGERDSAFVYYDKALELDPLNMMALNNSAYYLACEGKDLDRAERMSAMTVKNDPDNPTSLDTYAWVLFKRADYQNAKEYIDKVLAIDDEPSAEVYHHAGDIYFMLGDPDAALSYWKDALKLEPDNDMLKKKVKYKTYFYK